MPETFAAELDRPGWFYRAGFYRGLGTRLVGETKIYGVGIASSTATRIDLDQAFGSQLAVFLPRPAFVDILRDGRLISTRYYPAGNRAIDTADLPDGAYTVTLRIREVSGATREETRFFAKSDALPPGDQPLYFADAGVIAQRRTRGFAPPSAEPIGRIGTRYRVSTNFALGAELLGARRDGMAEANAFYIGPFARISASALATVHGDWGGGLAVQANYRKFSAGASARYIRAARARSERPDEPGAFRFVNGSSTQFNGSLGYHFKYVRLGLTGQWQRSDQPGARRIYAFGPNVHATLVENPRHQVFLIGEFSKTEQGYAAFAKLSWRWEAPRRIIVTADAGMRAIRSDANRELRETGRIELSYQPGLVLDHEVALQSSIIRDGPLVAAIGGQIAGPAGRATGNLRHTLEGPRPGTFFGATYSGGIAIDARGIAVGGRDGHPSGVIVKVQGPAGSGRYRVLVDGSPRLTVKAGETRPLFLAPYKAYTLDLKPDGGDGPMANIANMRRRVVLYPGTAQTLVWNVEPVTVVFGQLVLRDGTPVANSRIEGAVGEGETDERGYFQIEVGSAAALTVKREGGPDCRLNVAPPKKGAAFFRLGRVVCDGGAPAVAQGAPGGRR